MEADWSVELGPEAPALELPWHDPEGRWHYVNLRGAPVIPERGCIPPDPIADAIPEARQFPALGRFLAEANSPQSLWQTAKCGVWAEEAEAAENLYGAGFALSSYVDLVLAAPAAALRGNLEAHQRFAQELAQSLAQNQSLEACAEIVVRRCYFHPEASPNPEDSDAGYCLTLFLIGYGQSRNEAAECWERALEFAAECLLKLHPGKSSA